MTNINPQILIGVSIRLLARPKLSYAIRLLLRYAYYYFFVLEKKSDECEKEIFFEKQNAGSMRLCEICSKTSLNGVVGKKSTQKRGSNLFFEKKHIRTHHAAGRSGSYAIRLLLRYAN